MSGLSPLSAGNADIAGDRVTSTTSSGDGVRKADLQARALIGADGQISTNGNVPAGGLSSPSCKNILLSRIFGLSYISLRPVPPKGALRNVNNAGRDAVDADGASDEGT
jgi:hypothetical protein